MSSNVNDMLISTRYLTREQIANTLGDLMQNSGWELTDIMDIDRILKREYDDNYIDRILNSEKYLELFGKEETASTKDRTINVNYDHLIDDPENNAAYDPKLAYVQQPRERFHGADKI